MQAAGSDFVRMKPICILSPSISIECIDPMPNMNTTKQTKSDVRRRFKLVDNQFHQVSPQRWLPPQTITPAFSLSRLQCNVILMHLLYFLNYWCGVKRFQSNLITTPFPCLPARHAIRTFSKISRRGCLIPFHARWGHGSPSARPSTQSTPTIRISSPSGLVFLFIFFHGLKKFQFAQPTSATQFTLQTHQSCPPPMWRISHDPMICAGPLFCAGSIFSPGGKSFIPSRTATLSPPYGWLLLKLFWESLQATADTLRLVIVFFGR